MSVYRATDEELEREILTVQAIARLRVRRYARELNELERDLAAMRAERARRRAKAQVPGAIDVALSAAAE